MIIMSMECEIDRLQNMVEQCHAEMHKLKETTYVLVEQRNHYLDLLEIVRDAGWPHPEHGELKCPQCEAYKLVVGELAK